MSLNVGCDVVCMSRFAERIREGGTAFLERIFFPFEYENATLERLAGLFAAKEAAIKALGNPAGSWRAFEIFHATSGAPILACASPAQPVLRLQVSISHDGDYAFAVVIAQTA